MSYYYFLLSDVDLPVKVKMYVGKERPFVPPS